MATHEGSGHFKWQRLTSIAMLPLMVYSVAVIVALVGADYATTTAWLSSPLVWLPLLALILLSIWHMRLGMQVIIEDYVHNEKIKLAAIIANQFFAFTVGVVSLYAILKLSSGV